MSIQAVQINFVCYNSQEKQTPCSLITRVTAAAVGAIALIIGVLILCKIPILASLGTTAGWSFSAAGAFSFLAAICLSCTEENALLTPPSLMPARGRQKSVLKPVPKRDEVVHKKEKLVPQIDGLLSNEEEMDQASFKGNLQLTHLKEINHSSKMASHNQNVSKKAVGFAEITPANYWEHIDVTENKDYKLETRRPGDFAFRIDSYTEDRTLEGCSYQPKRGDPFLRGCVTSQGGIRLNGLGLNIYNGKFICQPQLNGPEEYFSNLKEFLDKIFLGTLYHGECMKELDLVTLRAPDGSDLRYDNPHRTVL